MTNAERLCGTGGPAQRRRAQRRDQERAVRAEDEQQSAFSLTDHMSGKF